MVTNARASKATGNVISAVPRISEWYTPGETKPTLSHSLEFRAEFDSERDANKLPVKYAVSLDDPSRILTPKKGHVDYAHIVETDLHLLMRDI